MSNWPIESVRTTFAIPHWSDGYFDVSPEGHVIALPKRCPEEGVVDLIEVTEAAKREGLSLPLLVRFVDIIQDRVVRLFKAFEQARQEYGYRGGYTPIYPIKVNQQRSVIEAILQSPVPQVGLEAGSKPELLAVLALAENGMPIVCNGYKDRAYIRLALIGRKLGLNPCLVIEKPSEIHLILEEAERLEIEEPLLGVRLRLTSVPSGKWQNSGGEKAKFGLTAPQLVDLIETLRRAGRLSWLRVMHFHVGSQVADIGDFRKALREASRYYAELRRLGAPIEIVDAGGGLGVDYEGNRSCSFCSINYSLEEYAHNVVRALWEVCEEADLPHPALMTESGRALTAHHAILITNVVEVERPPTRPEEDHLDNHPLLADLSRAFEHLEGGALLSLYHDAQLDLREARELFSQGKLSLEQLAAAERLSAALSEEICRRLDISLRAHREAIEALWLRLADKVFCNFSLFQSMPDAWAIEQIFPVMPLQRLNEPLTRRGRLMDLTCDSDGALEHYVDHQSIEPTIPIHEIRPDERYLLGFFMVGAYQEILGDCHNLFGDTHSVNVILDGQGGWRLVDPLTGDQTDDLLRYVHIDPELLLRRFRKKLAEAENLPSEWKRQFHHELISGLKSYTYLEEP